MATFVMQCLGCDVSAINTVNYSEPRIVLVFMYQIQLAEALPLQAIILRTSKSKVPRPLPSKSATYTKA
jgi:hypothetical protein